MARLDITRELAEFVVETRYQELSAETVHAAKTMILDTLGCGIAGFVLSKDEIAPVFRVINDMGGKEECTLLVSGKRTS